MQWFPFQLIVFNTAGKFNHPEEHLQSLLKVFSVFDVRIFYYETISLEDVP